ncbi:MAG: YebC/PmpR family DNA-binding transcriptional regulator [Clostridia bacterium]|nr:YebC/PmpR family DNA-binding transcriptional regulator [Clostridia bacterium]
MSGHSKWNNIKHKKEKADAQRGKIFTKVGREIAVCVKQGGPDPTMNTRLKDIIAKAKANNVPNDNIERIIKKAAGETDGNSYEDITYEGYGPNGTAVIVKTLTDNRNRTAGDLRHYFDKFGGNLGQSGSVSWQFKTKGLIVIEAEDVDEDELMEVALEAGADDISNEGEVFEVYTDPADFSAVLEGIQAAAKYNILSAQVEMIPDTYITLTDEDSIKNMQKLLDILNDNDDVQEVYHNCDNEDIE